MGCLNLGGRLYRLSGALMPTSGRDLPPRWTSRLGAELNPTSARPREERRRHGVDRLTTRDRLSSEKRSAAAVVAEMELRLASGSEVVDGGVTFACVEVWDVAKAGGGGCKGPATRTTHGGVPGADHARA